MTSTHLFQQGVPVANQIQFKILPSRAFRNTKATQKIGEFGSNLLKIP